MAIVRFMIGNRDGLRHRILCPIGGHLVADGGHGLGQMGSDEGVRADDHDLFRPSLIPKDRLLPGLQIYDGQPLTSHNSECTINN